MKINKIYNEDCLKTMGNMEDNFVDLTVTSPPYDNLRTYGKDIDKTWGEKVWKPIIQELFRVTKDGGVVVWVVGDATQKFSESGTSFEQALHFKSIGFNLLDTMIWVKPNYAPGYPTLRRYDNVFEYMFVFSKGRPNAYNLIIDNPKKQISKERTKYRAGFTRKDGSRKHKDALRKDNDFCRRTNVWTFPNGQIRGLKHPAPFPEKLANDHIISWSNEGDLVYDPFMGSGTTAKMAKINKRNYIGSEISKEYCEIAENRLTEIGK